jgi:4-hydroxybenzoate polyprenyltransferase
MASWSCVLSPENKNTLDIEHKETDPSRRAAGYAYLRLLRPRQWTKNVFVLVGLMFGHAWRDPVLVHGVLLATIAFALASSAVYILNDFIDRDSDRQHPRKASRPLANGSASAGIALGIAAVCAGAALLIAFSVAPRLAYIVVAYLLLNAAYSLRLKHVPILDVFAISLGFVLRLLAGTVGVGIEPSGWLILCGMLLTLFLGFAKRRTESALLDANAGGHRRVLDRYNPLLLDHLTSICAAATIVTYGLYTVSPHVIALHGTTNLAYSVPFAVYGMFRYLYRVFQNLSEGDVAEDFLRDPHLIFSVLGWCATVVWALA